jgi:4-carboxymuconolactone decarboxylase
LTEPVPRILPVHPPEWDETAYDVMSALPHGRDNILAGWKAGTPPLGTNFVCTLLRHPPLAKAFLTFNAYFFYASKLSLRVREILIMRMAWLRHAECEFLAHAAIGRRAGLVEADVERIQLGPEAPGLDPADADLLRAVDELKADARIGAQTWARLGSQFDTEQLLELVFVVGCYEVLAMAFNSFEIQLEPGATPLDPETRVRLEKS